MFAMQDAGAVEAHDPVRQRDAEIEVRRQRHQAASPAR